MAAGGTDGLLAALRARELDVAFVAVQAASVPDLHLDAIAEYQPRVLVPAGHPLAERTTVSRAALADEPFIDLPPGFGNRIRTDHDFRRVTRMSGVVGRRPGVSAAHRDPLGRALAHGSRPQNRPGGPPDRIGDR